jgi:microcin C transport system substrate-binding protein
MRSTTAAPWRGAAAPHRGALARVVLASCAVLRVATALMLAAPCVALAGPPSHGISLFGDLRYPADFRRFDYVNADAPKGGRVRIPAPGTFDSLNGFIRKGQPALGTLTTARYNYIYDTLAVPSQDEPASYYGLLAETIELADDRSYIEFVLRKEARWHDGVPVTADDVVFTFETLRTKGSPTLQLTYGGISGVEKRGPRTVRFSIRDRRDRQLPLAVARMPVVPKHYWETREFDQTTLEPPLASGPYRIAEVEPGRRIVYERVHDYWGKDLPVNVGSFNFDQIVLDYFLDLNVRLEALKGNVVDLVSETVSKTWVEGYGFPARLRGDVVQEVLETRRPAMARVILFNVRLPKFSDVRVRQAIAYAFDREWTNRVLTHGVFLPADSYFAGSDFAQRGTPSEAELALLEPFRDSLPPALFEGPFSVPRTPAVGRNRENLKVAAQLLKDAGYEVRDGVLVDPKTGRPFTINLLLDAPERTRMSVLFADALRRLGIETKMRVIDSSQRTNRIRSFDFEMIYSQVLFRDVPGTELLYYFTSAAADNPNSRNYGGIKSPVVDALVVKVLSAQTYDELITACRALDRVLLFGYYTIDLGHAPGNLLAYWNRFGKPEPTPPYGTGLPHLWWFDAERDAALGTRRPVTGGEVARE